eukprot:CAMPEP_0168544822 /NCGR_PEP_ID=MMETSP0413-20121227/2626_1 /TAXON_ID=136452 /ORGANISM="Filamoeba nolandi, Strain NC-AS-23-1" /LENGTH=678 /DNA_ID=CAMNT_0008574871 /DNA_START=489 /DNA_END=2525 /DNA_ORIENTATION=-
MKLLVEKGATIDPVDKDNCTPLHNAAFTGKKKCIEFLLDHGSNIDHGDIDNATPLHKAVYGGHQDCAELLIDRRCNINAADNEGITAIQKSVYTDSIHCLDLLVSLGADKDWKDHKGSTALHKAAFNGNVPAVQLLVQHGATVNILDNESTTPLHNAVYNGHTDVVRILIEGGADLNLGTARYKSTPLHFAAFNGYYDCVKLLLDKGSQIDARDVKEMTPFHYAVKREHEDCVELLMERGADINAQDYKGRKWSQMSNSKAMAQIVLGQRKAIRSPTRTPTLSPSGTMKYSDNNMRNNNNLSSSNQSQEQKQSPSGTIKRSNELSPSSASNTPTKPGTEEEYEIYSRLDRNGFLLSGSEPEDDPEATRIEVERAVKWSKMLGKWDSAVKKDLKKIKTRCEKGIPARVRGQAWKLITKSTLEQFPLRKMTDYKELLLEECEHSAQITKDINRTFPKNILLMQKGGQDALFNVLKANAVYNKDIGYTQGMGFVTALLLMYMDEEDAFWVLVRLCSDYELADLWRPGFPGLTKCVFIVEKLQEEYVPRLFNHIKKEGISTSLYLTQWFLTIFLYNLPFSVALRIWDTFLFEGFHFSYAVVIAIFKLFENELLSLSFEPLWSFLQFNGNTRENAPVIDVEQLMRIANGVKEKIKRSLKGLEKEFEKFKLSKDNDKPQSRKKL